MPQRIERPARVYYRKLMEFPTQAYPLLTSPHREGHRIRKGVTTDFVDKREAGAGESVVTPFRIFCKEERAYTAVADFPRWVPF
jgi:hypothetical protein